MKGSLNLNLTPFLSLALFLNTIHIHMHRHVHMCILGGCKIRLVAYPMVAYFSSPFFIARTVFLPQEDLKFQLLAFPASLLLEAAMCTVVRSNVTRSGRGPGT